MVCFRFEEFLYCRPHIYMLWNPFGTLTLLNSSQRRLQLTINDNNHRNVWETVIVLSPYCFFQCISHWSVIKTSFHNSVSSKCICLKYNIDAVKKQTKNGELHELLQGQPWDFHQVLISSTLSFVWKVLHFWKIPSQGCACEPRSIRNIIFTCISFMHKHNGLKTEKGQHVHLM